MSRACKHLYAAYTVVPMALPTWEPEVASCLVKMIPRLALYLAPFSMAVVPAMAFPFEPNVVVGVGKVGAHQFDQGAYQGVVTVNQTAIGVGRSFFLGGLGMAIRGSDDLFKGFDEFGLSIPVVTYRRCAYVAEFGAGIQGSRKYFFYIGVGASVRSWIRLRRSRVRCP